MNKKLSDHRAQPEVLREECAGLEEDGAPHPVQEGAHQLDHGGAECAARGHVGQWGLVGRPLHAVHQPRAQAQNEIDPEDEASGPTAAAAAAGERNPKERQVKKILI